MDDGPPPFTPIDETTVHELRTGLTIAPGRVQLLRARYSQGRPPADPDQHLAMVEQALERMVYAVKILDRRP